MWGERALRQAGVGSKTRSAGRGPATRATVGGRGAYPIELSCTGRGLHVTQEMRTSAEHKLARLARMEPRATRIEVEVIVEKNPRLAHLMRVEAALDIPRKTFRAHADGPDHDKALD